MRIYTVHLRRHGLDPERDVVLVREGFSWAAFVLNALWAFWHRLWWMAALLTAVVVVIGGLDRSGLLDAPVASILSLAVAVLAGLFGNDVRRRALAEQGFVAAAVVSGDDADAALRRFLDQDPVFASDLAGSRPGP